MTRAIPSRSGMMERTRLLARRKTTMSEQSLNRRKFFGSAAALSLSAAGYANVPGSNERLRIGFIGCGGRAQAHIDTINRLAASSQPVAVCDVWDGQEDE